MTILMVRDDCTDTRTLGTMTFPDGFVCQTLEDPVRPAGVKVFGDTAIPSGTYKVTITRSQKFQKMLPLLHEVPGFGGVRIHAGNTTMDTMGCVLVGSTRTDHSLVRSRDAITQVQTRIAAALATGDVVWVDIVTPRVTTSETFAWASPDATGFPQ